MPDRWGRFAAVTGLLFIAALVASIVTGGSTPNSDATGAAVITFYKANKNSQMTSAAAGAIAVVFFVFFGAVLWNRLRSALPASSLPAAGLAGAAMTGVGGALFSALGFALTDVPDKIDPSTAQALNVLSNDIFFPFALGIAVFLIANGLAIARSGFLPRWLGWVAVVIAVFALTPLGIIVFFGSALWVLVASVIMLVRDLRAPPEVAAPAAG